MALGVCQECKLPGIVQREAELHLFGELEREVGQEHGHSGLVVDLCQVLPDAVPGPYTERDKPLHLQAPQICSSSAEHLDGLLALHR